MTDSEKLPPENMLYDNPEDLGEHPPVDIGVIKIGEGLKTDKAFLDAVTSTVE